MFKTGDKVRRIGDFHNPLFKFDPNQIYIVRKAGDDFIYLKDVEFCFASYNFTLVKSKRNLPEWW